MWRDSDADQQQVSHERQPPLLHVLRRGLPAARRLRRILAHIRRATFLLGVLRRRRRGGALPQAPRWGEREYRVPCRRDSPLSQFRKPLASGAPRPLPPSHVRARSVGWATQPNPKVL